MARTVADVALFLDAMAEPHPSDPLAGTVRPPMPFSQAIAPGALPPPRRVAFTPDLGGAVTVDPAISAACEAAASWFESPGSDAAGGAFCAEVVRDCPDLSWAPGINDVLRALAFKRLVRLRDDPKKAALLGAELRFQLERSARLARWELAMAISQHDAMLAGVAEFFEEVRGAVGLFVVGFEGPCVGGWVGVGGAQVGVWVVLKYSLSLNLSPTLILHPPPFCLQYDLLICPVAPTLPFDATEHTWPQSVGGRKMSHYYDWLALSGAWLPARDHFDQRARASMCHCLCAFLCIASPARTNISETHFTGSPATLAPPFCPPQLQSPSPAALLPSSPVAW